MPSATTTEDSVDRMSLLAEVASQAKDISKDERKKMKEKLPRIELIKLSAEDISDARKKALEDGETVVKVKNEDSSEMVDVESRDEKEQVKPAKVSEMLFFFLIGSYAEGKIENQTKKLNQNAKHSPLQIKSTRVQKLMKRSHGEMYELK